MNAIGSTLDQRTVDPFPNAQRPIQRRYVGFISIIQSLLIGFLAFLGGFVFFEPAPYEVFFCILIGGWVLFGIRIPRTIVPLLVLLLLFNAGGVISTFQIDEIHRGLFYIAVSFFLALSTIFFAIVISDNPQRMNAVFLGYLFSAVFSSILGIAGYFNTPGFESFTRDLRARGGFEDPNVFAPFLLLPTLWLMHKLLTSKARFWPLVLAGLSVLILAQFLAFSRASWGLTVACVATFFFIQFIGEPRPKVRMRYIFVAVFGVFAAAIAILGALQFEEVSALLSERARLIQPYDAGELGRFGRHSIAVVDILKHPFGFAPLEFGYTYGEHVHNSFLKAGLAYGWIGIFCWTTIMVMTTVGGALLLFRKRPWQSFLQISWIVFVWHIAMSYVIDIDHWRHFYLIMGLIWACILLEVRWHRTLLANMQAPR